MKKLVISIVSVLFILVGCGNDAQYGEDIQLLADDIIENSERSETVLQGYSDIWNLSIQSRSAIGIDDVIGVTGLEESTVREYFAVNVADNVPGDFNLNIASLNSYYQANGMLDEIEETSDGIQERITELNDSPADYEEAYDELLNLYTYSEEYAELTLNPQGSLQSFNENRNELSSEISNTYRRIEVLIPSE